MNRIALPLFVATCLWAASIYGQDPPRDAISQESVAQGQPALMPPSMPQPEVSVIRHEFDVAAEPSPALLYRLRNPDSMLQSGDVTESLMRAVLIMQRVSNQRDLETQLGEKLESWMEETLGTDAQAEIETYLDAYGDVIREVHHAATLRSIGVDSRFDRLFGAEVYSMRLDELQELRRISRLIVLQGRLALARRDQKLALQCIQTNVRVAEAASLRTPTLIGRLIGLAIASQSLELVREFCTSPNAPNMYWAIATFPRASFDMQPAYEMETDSMRRFLGKLPTRDEAMEPALWRARLVKVVEDLQTAGVGATGLPSSNDPAVLAGIVMIFADGPAQEYLRRQGFNVSRMPPSEAILRALDHQLTVTRDSVYKWTLLPNAVKGDRLQLIPGSEPVMSLTDESQFFPAAVIAGLLLPAIGSVENAGLRLNRELALLATAEAVRMHAAKFGKMPASIKDLTPVPAWPEPSTSQHFEYQRVDDQNATLSHAAFSHSKATVWKMKERSQPQ